ncbi:MULTISPECIES: protease SohB [unclassified Gilliamella]|uniref:protease SohB n=1 Tax=unclassified Gilliamella TaxID=2685620 RepID=UPI000810AC49|nr:MULTISPECIES: protease SohB [Gilliamella]MCX8585596.1 protease SohB [Gilliamella sp. B3562]MCX8596369.1 protease SohB [Gilliamella sp. B3493]MCX8598736.1 protease SohB [Gilliamella sp. B3486]MCX8662216.1 protease SohB [Gilliamella sp. B2911]MCX8670470.1 protease SohB [Gilliamella sp. B2785]
MNWFSQYSLFLAETATVVIAILAVLIFILSQRRKSSTIAGRLSVKDISEEYEQVKDDMLTSSMDEIEAKQFTKDLKKQKKLEKKQAKQAAKKKDDNAKSSDAKPKLFVLSFNGSMDAHEVEELRQEITAVLAVIKPEDQVVVKLESPGGVVHGYGLAASQLLRFRTRNIPFTAVVDKVAASGGYMMACTASKIVAAPFAIVGSIGVVAQIPNFNRLLKKHDVDIELQTAGEYKRTLTMFGENTDEGRQKFKQELEQTHLLFKDFVKEYRPNIDIDQVATGEHWFATQAKEMGLVDEISTSDDFILSHLETHKIIAVNYQRKQKLSEKLSKNVVKGMEKLFFRQGNGL